MAYVPISGILPQLARNAGGAAASGYFLKGYEAGTTTPLSMGVDATPSSTLAKCSLNTRGEPISDSGNEDSWFIPHFDESYVLYLYADEDDADNNVTANALWNTGDLSLGFDASTLPVTINSLSRNSVQSYLENKEVPDYATLRALPSAQLADGDKVWVEGFPDAWEVATGTVTDTGYDLVFSDDSNRYARSTSDQPTIELFGAVGDGATDDSPAFLLARSINRPVKLKAGTTYAIAAQVAANGDDQGFYCDDGIANILILTGAGEFDRSDYTGTRFDADAMPFYCLSYDRYVFKGIHVKLQTGNGLRVVGALSVRDSDGASVDCEVSLFTDTENGVVNVDSCTNGRFIVNGHDIGTSDDTLATKQITVLDIDNNRIGDAPTTSSYAKSFGKNVLLAGAALTKYGQQTDGLNISGSGKNCDGLEVHSAFDGIGEVLDCFSSNVVGTAQGTNVQGYTLKLIHGARNNKIKVVARDTATAALVLGGSSIASQTVKGNSVDIVCSGIGALGGSLRKAAVYVDGPSATYKPENNYVKVVASECGDMDYVADFEAGDHNTVEYIVESTETFTPVRYGPTAGRGNTCFDVRSRKYGYISSRYYSGEYLDITSTDTIALSADVLYFSPMRFRDFKALTSVNINVTTFGSATLARFGVYRVGDDGEPTVLLYDIGELSISGTGNNALSVASGAGLSLDGDYYLAMVVDTAITIRGTQSTERSIVDRMGASSVNGAGANRPYIAHTYGALPTTVGTVSYDSNNFLNIFLRASS